MDLSDQKYLRLIYLLQDWAQWMHGYQGVQGYATRSAGMQSGYVSLTFDEMCESMDACICEAINASINDLPLPQQSAIMHKYLRAAFRFPRGNYLNSLEAAHETLLVKLTKKGVVCA